MARERNRLNPLGATPLAILVLAATLPSGAQEKTFRMGPVDLLSLAAATPEVLDRWDRLARGVRSYPRCAAVRPP